MRITKPNPWKRVSPSMTFEELQEGYRSGRFGPRKIFMELLKGDKSERHEIQNNVAGRMWRLIGGDRFHVDEVSETTKDIRACEGKLATWLLFYNLPLDRHESYAKMFRNMPEGKLPMDNEEGSRVSRIVWKLVNQKISLLDAYISILKENFYGLSETDIRHFLRYVLIDMKVAERSGWTYENACSDEAFYQRRIDEFTPSEVVAEVGREIEVLEGYLMA